MRGEERREDRRGETGRGIITLASSSARAQPRWPREHAATSADTTAEPSSPSIRTVVSGGMPVARSLVTSAVLPPKAAITSRSRCASEERGAER